MSDVHDAKGFDLGGADFLDYLSVSDRNGYQVMAKGDADPSISACLREVFNISELTLPYSTDDIKVIIEGEKKAVILQEKDDFVVGICIEKSRF